jgi:hemoglobin-like flavoprotein
LFEVVVVIIGQVEWQVHVLEQSMGRLAPVGEAVAQRFYEVLFDHSPDLKSLFQGTSMKEQHKKLWSALRVTVEGFHNPEQLRTTLLELGFKHKEYGVRPKDYDTVRVILLKVLREFLGESWSTEMQLAWSLALYEVSQIMLEGANQTQTEKAFN